MKTAGLEPVSLLINMDGVKRFGHVACEDDADLSKRCTTKLRQRLTELRYYVPSAQNRSFRGRSFELISWRSTEETKRNLTQQKQTTQQQNVLR